MSACIWHAGRRANCKKISKRIHCFKREPIGEMTEKYEYCSTVPRTFVRDIVARWYSFCVTSDQALFSFCLVSKCSDVRHVKKENETCYNWAWSQVTFSWLYQLYEAQTKNTQKIAREATHFCATFFIMQTTDWRYKLTYRPIQPISLKMSI